MSDTDHNATLLPGDPSAAVKTEALPKSVPIDWVDPDGTVFASFAHEWMTVNDLLALLGRVKPENRAKPLVFSVRLDPSKPERFQISLVTRPVFELDTIDGDKAVFMNPLHTTCGLNFILTPTTDTRYALAVFATTKVENEDQPLSEAGGSVPSEAQKQAG